MARRSAKVEPRLREVRIDTVGAKELDVGSPHLGGANCHLRIRGSSALFGIWLSAKLLRAPCDCAQLPPPSPSLTVTTDQSSLPIDGLTGASPETALQLHQRSNRLGEDFLHVAPTIIDASMSIRLCASHHTGRGATQQQHVILASVVHFDY
ncbi:uncharacterized protein CLUP02_09949 [Colletotrichum lupini]|uniref:Uncharacterized protein n=1 Tax=Colletotrichum lupini TaxID=145971 RepID=A0A9Q8SXJ6_9PEZI|nr:uncharacterized protein CLUP02_09949 [Colletotrichum lupini]UQC84452.1 hypothetical protein CLUP02_09949 [Colletotrichum lupini]